MSDESFSIEVRGLDQLIKALKVKPPVVRIGVIGTQARKPKNGQGTASTNAEVGAVHEFGAPGRNIPQRSFLRVPLMNHLNGELDKAGLTDEEYLKKVIKQGSLLPWVEALGTIAMGVVMNAFETSGDGQWPAWRDPNYTNQGGQLLVDTQQLRDSINWEVQE